MIVDARLEGRPVWVSLSAEDPGAASAFYSGLLGRKVRENAPIAGIGPREGALRASWRIFVRVSDVKASIQKAIDAGGSVLREPRSLGTAGCTAVIADPSGAEVGLCEASDSDASIDGPCAYVWSELIADDIPAAAAFYHNVFGWTLSDPKPDDMMRRREWHLHGQSIAGLLPRPPAMPKEIPPYWDVFFAVNDPAVTIERGTALGAKTLMPARDTTHGKIAVFADPAGVVFSVITKKEDL